MIALGLIITVLKKNIEMQLSTMGSTIPSSLANHYLSEQQFDHRFTLLNEIQDPYTRIYEICRDMQTNKRVAVRSYLATEQQQHRDIIENMENFRKLGSVQGMSKLIAFASKQASGLICAAFQYNSFSVDQLLLTHTYSNIRHQLYLLILKEIASVVQNAKHVGILIEDIIPSCLLLEATQGSFRLKILYDEREKRYDKIQEGVKVFASPEKVETFLREMKDYESINCEEAVFELGLLLLDFMYQFELQSSRQSNQNVFTKDFPLQKSNLLHKSYLLLENEASVQLNHRLIEQKMQFLSQGGNSFISHMLPLIRAMIAPIDDRIQIQQIFDHLADLQDALHHFQQQRTQEAAQYNTFSTPAKHKPPPQTSKHIGKKQVSGKDNIIKGVNSQTTANTPRYLSSQDYFPRQQAVDDRRGVEIVIPKEKLLHQARSNPTIGSKLEQFIGKVEARPATAKKEYYNSSVYYGELSSSNKRDGIGIYLDTNGDIYFGSWKDNNLTQGNYIFRNGESFEGFVKNGKQGYGRYCYANGNIYEGEWRDDVKSGAGKMTYPNGDVYDGMWSKGKKNGQGKYIYNNSTVYVGSFVDGKKNGFGVITFPNGTRVQAYWNQTHVEGPGKVSYSNGNYFQGNYHLSQKEGKGFYKWEDAEYEGQFKKDLMEGTACIRFSQKQYYNGSIKNGKRDGRGYYRYPNGDHFEGDWRHDQKILGLYKFHQGGSFEGRFKNNQLSYGVMKYENGQSYEGEFGRGERHGLGIYRGEKNEILYEGRWERDQFLSPH